MDRMNHWQMIGWQNLLCIAARGEEFDDVLNPWDTSYYERILLEKEYSLDQEKIKKYFSLETTIQSEWK